MKTYASRGIVLVALAMFGFSVLAHADTLELKNGTVVQGKYLGGTEYNVRFQVNGNVKYYATKDILTLSFDESASKTPAAPPAAVPAGAPAAAPDNSQAATTAAAQTASRITVPAGTVLTVRMIDSVDSTTNQVGDQFDASLDQPLVINGTVVAPKGSDIYGKLAEVKAAGSLKGRSELQLELTGIRINGNIVPITSGDYDVAGSSRGKQSAERIGGGAALGAIIGAIAGGGKGAAIGAAVGGGAGTAVQVMTKGQQVRVPSETVLDFTLQAPFSIPAAWVS